MEIGLTERARALQQLLDSPGWKILVELVDQQLLQRKGLVVYRPLSGADAVYEQEYIKGEISGQELVLRLPAAMIEELNLQIEESDNGPASE